MYDTNAFTMALKVCAPLILLALGLILPFLAKRERAQQENAEA